MQQARGGPGGGAAGSQEVRLGCSRLIGRGRPPFPQTHSRVQCREPVCPLGKGAVSLSAAFRADWSSGRDWAASPSNGTWRTCTRSCGEPRAWSGPRPPGRERRAVPKRHRERSCSPAEPSCSSQTWAQSRGATRSAGPHWADGRAQGPRAPLPSQLRAWPERPLAAPCASALAPLACILPPHPPRPQSSWPTPACHCDTALRPKEEVTFSSEPLGLQVSGRV